ncbi:MAG: ABC transporter permease [Bacteroidales bacterium]|jgi:spermidine/putrescine transport system permease protein|nr:ABC transporter permease [Bacteroidales bacterium]MBQ3658642.1 ABC transporter permease [Bacteroidales bacterium]MBQ5402519.1 ABC transporter permease [Bacteroidales bacterium]MBQ7458828.1 ABC transporter permease [Bacteroidales bacterium]
MARLSNFIGKRSNWSIPYTVFLIIFVALPLVLIMGYAFVDEGGGFTLGNITRFFTDSDALSTFAVSIEIALETTAICLLLGYPVAWLLANSKYNSSSVTIIIFILPMWINALMRTLATADLFNMLGITLGKGTLLFGMVYDYLPFMIYPIYNVLRRMDPSYAEAAQDLGAKPATVFANVTLPLSLPGITSGIMMVFMPTVSTFAISEFLTNNKIKLFGTIIQENINSSMWNYGAALSFIMLIIIGITTLLTGGAEEEDHSTQGGLI